MRAYLFASLAFASACYSPSLSDEPFTCGDTAPECPDGYDCNSGVCVKSGGSGGGGDGCVDDAIEPNDAIGSATETQAGSRMNDPLVLYPLAICPSGDVDVFAVTTPGSTSGLTLTAAMIYDSGGAALTMQLVNASNQPVTTSTTTGSTINAVLSDPPSNTPFYVVVQAASPGGQNTYRLSLGMSGQ